MSRTILFTTCSTVAECKARLNSREKFVSARKTRAGMLVTVRDVVSRRGTRKSTRARKRSRARY